MLAVKQVPLQKRKSLVKATKPLLQASTSASVFIFPRFFLFEPALFFFFFLSEFVCIE